VQHCIDALNSCVARYKSGNDKEDCQDGSVSVCFAASDLCMERAAGQCEGIQNPCGSAPALIGLGGIAALCAFAWRK
jgi:hypothetical protein